MEFQRKMHELIVLDALGWYKNPRMINRMTRGIRPETGKSVALSGSYKMDYNLCIIFADKCKTGWWFQTIWKIFAKLGIFPR